nr:hypothetical protein [Lactococcus taiwanensis]
MFKKIKFIKFNIADISEDELPNLKTIGLSSAKRLVQQATKANKTIGEMSYAHVAVLKNLNNAV